MKLLKNVPHAIQLKENYMETSFQNLPTIIMEYIDGCDTFSLFIEKGCDNYFLKKFAFLTERKVMEEIVGFMKSLSIPMSFLNSVYNQSFADLSAQNVMFNERTRKYAIIDLDLTAFSPTLVRTLTHVPRVLLKLLPVFFV